eukprot:2180461-Pleurochrysis_carterae.AAC.1
MVFAAGTTSTPTFSSGTTCPSGRRGLLFQFSPLLSAPHQTLNMYTVGNRKRYWCWPGNVKWGLVGAMCLPAKLLPLGVRYSPNLCTGIVVREADQDIRVPVVDSTDIQITRRYSAEFSMFF